MDKWRNRLAGLTAIHCRVIVYRSKSARPRDSYLFKRRADVVGCTWCVYFITSIESLIFISRETRLRKERDFVGSRCKKTLEAILLLLAIPRWEKSALADTSIEITHLALFYRNIMMDKSSFLSCAMFLSSRRVVSHVPLILRNLNFII